MEAEERERVFFASILRPDYDVTTASSGREALRFLGGKSFDLVLLGSIGQDEDSEILVPGLSSTVFRPKVLLLTPSFSREVVDRATTVSADGVLESRDPGEVAASVAAHLGS